MSRWWLVAVMIGVLLAGGCGSKITRENYEKIQTQMTLAEVEAILGKGKAGHTGGVSLDKLAISGGTYTWEADGKSITVVVLNDKVVTKSHKGL